MHSAKRSVQLDCHPLACFIKHMKLRLSHRYIESDRLCHGCSLRMPVAAIKLYPSRTKSSVIGSRDYRHVLFCNSSAGLGQGLPLRLAQAT